MKVAIIGSSIAGASAALLLAGHANVSVYEQKAKKDLGKKTCLNNVTGSFLEYARKLGLKSEKYIRSISNRAIIKSESNEIKFKTKEFKIDRQKFLDDLIDKAEKKGAKFYFNVNFSSTRMISHSGCPKNAGHFFGFEKTKKFKISLKKGNKKINVYADVLIGADGAMSKVAEQLGIKKRLYLILQKEVSLSKLKLKIEKNTYYVYVGKKYGYFSYIFPYRGKAIIGFADKTEKANSDFRRLLKELRLDSKNLGAALVPEPKVIKQKNNLFLIGDAGCNTKFSGGGIVPGMIAAFAARDAILHKDYRGFKKLNSKIRLNRLIFKAVKKMKDKDFDYLLEVLKNKKFSGLLEKRDKFGKSDYMKALDLRFLRFFPKLL